MGDKIDHTEKDENLKIVKRNTSDIGYETSDSKNETQVTLSTTTFPGTNIPVLLDPVSKTMEHEPDYSEEMLKSRFSNTLHYYLLRFISTLTIITGLLYLSWKISMFATHLSAINPVGFIFLFMEMVISFTVFMLVLEISVPSRDRPFLTMPEKGHFPTVSLFICCCNEQLDVIQDTVRGALSQNYPSDRFTVWVLDDGGDENLKEWVESESEAYSSQLKYVRRPKSKGVPHHYKAGNINYGLTLTDSDFVAILDADMIPFSNFLTSMLPHFTSKDIAFVQCPQAFYNLAKGDPLNDSSQDFYDIILPYRDGRDSAQCVGTGVIIRKECLRENGGFTTGSITEDFDTAMSFHSRGYKTVYIRQRLQAGLAPWNLEGYIKQHQRWATGSLQILWNRNPLFLLDKRFSLYRRLSYWYAGVQYYINVIVLLILIVPLLILAFDFPIMVENQNSKNQRMYIILLVPYIVSSRLLCIVLPSRLKNSLMVHIRGEQVWYWMSYFNVVAILKFLFPFVSRRFQATGSIKKSPSVFSRLKTLWFHITFITIAFGVVFWKLFTMDVHDCGQLLKILAWVPYILFGIQNMLVPIVHTLNPKLPKPQHRREMLNYDERGVPSVRLEQLWPEYDKKLRFCTIIPSIWAISVFFFFFAALVNLRPSFCTVSGFFDYRNF